MSTEFDNAAETILRADGLLIGAGAGMGVDSGLPDFRGDEGFWRAYPPFKRLGLSFYDLADPRWFDDDPSLAWGFYGHRLNLYRETTPHAGFDILREWGETREHGAFVFTSNVDGQFQRAGFSEERLVECHGSIHHLQCSARCSRRVWSGADARVHVDDSMHATGDLPRCTCGAVARPNILMFGDWGWIDDRTERQYAMLERWIRRVEWPVVVECGAGTTIPSVRRLCESVARQLSVPLVRINPREAHGPTGTLSLEMSALDGLTAIKEAM